MGKALMAWLLVASAVAAPVTGPGEIVQTAVRRVLAAIQRAAIDTDAPQAQARFRQQRSLELRRVAAGLFDFDEIARRALSRHWAARTAEEQAEFTRLFTELLERTYVGRIESYAGETIVYLGEAVDGSFATVRSKVITRRRTETPLDYQLHLREGRWKVYDVLIDHVSFVSTYRSEFARVIHTESYAALVERLHKQNGEAAALVRMR